MGAQANHLSGRILLIVAAFALFLVLVAAIAAAGFTDVADDSVFVADIQWMKDAGVTKGCNPPTNDKYCPSANVTREQMSAFMHRLAVNKVVDAATLEADHATAADSAMNAGKVDGYNANELTRSRYVQTTGEIDDFDSGPFTPILTGSATAPKDGILLIWANVNAEWDITSVAGSNADLDVQIFVDGVAAGVIIDQEFTDVGSNSGESINVSVAVPVTAGDHTVTIQARRVGGSLIYIKARSLVTLYEPFGNAGTAGTLGFTPSGSSDSGTANDR